MELGISLHKKTQYVVIRDECLTPGVDSGEHAGFDPDAQGMFGNAVTILYKSTMNSPNAPYLARNIIFLHNCPPPPCEARTVWPACLAEPGKEAPKFQIGGSRQCAFVHDFYHAETCEVC